MNILYEFLDQEPIDNVISCMHYRFDRVVYFGTHNRVRKMREKTSAFLSSFCRGSQNDIKFIELSEYKLEAVVKELRRNIERETKSGGKLFFDVTGGERLFLTAFGIVAGENKLPLHFYDVEKDFIIDYPNESGEKISESMRNNEQEVRMTLDRYIALQGGIINKFRSNTVLIVSDKTIFA